jgi:hypothetical protein
MNTSILQKCVAELTKDSPDLSYIKGILETLIDITGVATTKIIETSPAQSTFKVDEEEFNDAARAYVGGPIGKIT